MKKLFTFAAMLFAALTINAQETITCAQAKQLMPAQKDAETDVEYIVVGYVTKLSSNPSPSRTDANVMQQRFYMDDVKGSAETVNCYWCDLPEEYKETGLNVGDKISVKGKIINYNDQPDTRKMSSDVSPAFSEPPSSRASHTFTSKVWMFTSARSIIVIGAFFNSGWSL